jgi:hypothetical protein
MNNDRCQIIIKTISSQYFTLVVTDGVCKDHTQTPGDLHMIHLIGLVYVLCKGPLLERLCFLAMSNVCGEFMRRFPSDHESADDLDLDLPLQGHQRRRHIPMATILTISLDDSSVKGSPQFEFSINLICTHEALFQLLILLQFICKILHRLLKDKRGINGRAAPTDPSSNFNSW